MNDSLTTDILSLGVDDSLICYPDSEVMATCHARGFVRGYVEAQKSDVIVINKLLAEIEALKRRIEQIAERLS